MGRPNRLIQLYLTNLCNSCCSTCNIWRNRTMQELQSMIVIKNVINYFPDADYVFGGGEFTVYSQKDSLLSYCDEHRVSYTVLSNGINISMLKQLVFRHNIKNLTVSCDGVKHDTIRGVAGNLKNIEYIVKEFPNKVVNNIKVSYTLSKFNESCIDNDMAYFKSIGLNKIYFCIAQNMDLLDATGDITPSKESLIHMLELYSDMLYDKDIHMLSDFVNCIHRKCDSIRDVHTIYTNGDVVRCQSYLSSDTIGNIYNDNLLNILVRDKADNWENFSCPYNDRCELACQRRYDYEDRV